VGRRLGQHFLFDPAILDKIVAALFPEPDDVVLEIGSGKGTLTRRLATKVGRVITVETDPALAAELLDRESESPLPLNVSVEPGDALELDWHAMVESHASVSAGERPRFKAVGNIPYSITAPLIEKALQPPLPDVIVYLIQREVADRLSAPPGTKTFGALSVGVQSVASVERLFNVKPGSFSPPPAVESAVVRITPLPEPLVRESERLEFRRFVTAIFGQRRRQLSRALRTVVGGEKLVIDAMLERLKLEPSVRPEVLEPAELLRVFREVHGEPGSVDE